MIRTTKALKALGTLWFAGLATLATLAILGTAGPAAAQSDTLKGIEVYREMLADDNPAELYELRGAELWKKARGPKKVSLEKCDLGMGPGVVKNAYVRMPRYFADTGRVEDLESRLVSCMVSLQGYTAAEVIKKPFGNIDYKSDMEALVGWIVSESRGAKMDVRLEHPKEVEAYETGKRMFFYRAGPYDFACATCHAEDDKRIRLQELPNLTQAKGAQLAYTTWPAYRVSQGELRTMQWRLNDCYRQQRFPEPDYASDATIALTSYLAVSANGGVFRAPTIKR